MDLERLLEIVLGAVGEDERTDTENWIRDIVGKGSAYDDDLSVRDAKIEELTSANGEFSRQVQDLKARNYDLLMQIPAEPINDDVAGDGQVTETVDDGMVIHIDNLFDDPEEGDE